MSRHEHFEELAAIAALGRLDALHVEELSLHLAGCSRCKRIHDEFVELHAPLKPIAPEMDAIIEPRRDRIKTSVLQAVAAKQTQAAADARRGDRTTASAPSRRWLRHSWGGATVAAVALLGFWSGIRYGRQTVAAVRPFAEIVPVRPDQMIQHAPVENISTEQDVDTTAEEKNHLANDLKREKQQNAKLEAVVVEQSRELDEAKDARLALQQQLDKEAQEVGRTESDLASKTTELKKAETTKADDLNTIVALRYQVQELTDKLGDQKESLEREQQLLSSGRDIRDIIGARNLHIIDVYDTGPEGNLKRSFARAFYTEGKSLIFYAYDLPTRNTENGKFAYTAWGERNGNKKMIRNLGILLNDDKGQRRWVLNLSDPKVLAEIDSVFVTLERVDNELEQPLGKRMLTAYLVSRVNHP